MTQGLERLIFLSERQSKVCLIYQVTFPSTEKNGRRLRSNQPESCLVGVSDKPGSKEPENKTDPIKTKL